MGRVTVDLQFLIKLLKPKTEKILKVARTDSSGIVSTLQMNPQDANFQRCERVFAHPVT